MPRFGYLQTLGSWSHKDKTYGQDVASAIWLLHGVGTK